MKTEEGNIIIMEFDGWVKKSRQTFDPDHNVQNPGSNTYYVYEKDGSSVRLEDIEFDIVYHQSWNALMPVVEKIRDVSEMKTIASTIDYIFSRTNNLFNSITDLWDSVIQFIQWYNKQTAMQPGE